MWKHTNEFSAEIEADVPSPMRAYLVNTGPWRQLTEKREGKGGEGHTMTEVGISFSKQLMKLSLFHHEFWHKDIKAVVAEFSSP